VAKKKAEALSITFQPDGLIQNWDGESITVENEVFTIGTALLRLAATYQPPEGKPEFSILAYRVGQSIAKAMEEGSEFTAGEFAIGVLRSAWKQNGAGFLPLVRGPLGVLLQLEPQELPKLEDF